MGVCHFSQARNLIYEPKAQRLYFYAHQITLPSVHCSSLHCLSPHEADIVIVSMGHYENIAHQLCACKSFTKDW